MARVYATPADYLAVTGSAGPADIERRLARASTAVELALKTALYATDTDGYPTKAEHVEAFKVATCEQVRWWLTTGDELGDAGRWQSVSIGRVNMSRAGNQGPPATAWDRLGQLAREALDAAGLRPGAIYDTGGPCPWSSPSG